MSIYSSWTPSYPAPSVSGVTEGTIEVPTVVTEDWALKESSFDSATYTCTKLNGSAIGQVNLPCVDEVRLKVSVVNNPYGTDKFNNVPASWRIPGLSARKVYIQYIAQGTCLPDQGDDAPWTVAPLKASIALEIPTGVVVTKENLIDTIQKMLSFGTPVITSGETDPLGRVLAMQNGALLIK
jgi:hypothetical protein